MRMSNRISSFQCSPIRRLVPYSRAAEARGIHVVHLNIGQPDIATPEIALEVVRRLQISVIEYTDSAGNHTLRSALAGYYQRLGIHISEENILIGENQFAEGCTSLLEIRIAPEARPRIYTITGNISQSIKVIYYTKD